MPSLKGKEYKRFEDIKQWNQLLAETAHDAGVITNEEIEKEQMERLQKKAKVGKLMLDE